MQVENNKKTLEKMKTVFTTILLLCATFNAFAEKKNFSEEAKPINMETYKKMTQSTSNIIERGIIYYELNAYLFPDSKEVEVSIYNIGDVTISIIDSYGRVIDAVNTRSDFPTSILLNVTSGDGDYYIVISSPTIYAEGFFTL